MTNTKLPFTRPEADALRDVFADESTVVANAVADLFALHQPQKPPVRPLAKALAAVEAEEAEYGALSPFDRRRTRFVSAASGIPVEVIRYVLRSREIDRHNASRQSQSLL